MDLSQIETIIVVMMENRSFDHMLGYLSLPPYSRTDVDGLSPDPAIWASYANPYNGVGHLPFPLTRPHDLLPGDPLHDRGAIKKQIGGPNPPFSMKGFVESCSDIDKLSGNPVVMGYFNGQDLPTTDFFAKNFAICDRWFSSIPASTQPNRLMAMSGYTKIENNVSVLDEQPLVYDWLEDRKIKWRVYHQGIPFFGLMLNWEPYILLNYNFRDLSHLFSDIQHEGDRSFPQVIFVEPRYTDAPHILTPTDDHAPSAISGGQEFLSQVYAAVTSNPDRWSKTAMIVTYDEHGGFFDHVPPINLTTNPPSGSAYPPFVSSGVRVPAFVISPWVDSSVVYKQNLDHTSILKFIGGKFGDGAGYSPEVDARLVGSAGDVLNRTEARTDIPHPEPVIAGRSDGTPPTDMQGAFEGALQRLRAFDKDVAATKFPTLKNKL